MSHITWPRPWPCPFQGWIVTSKLGLSMCYVVIFCGCCAAAHKISTTDSKQCMHSITEQWLHSFGCLKNVIRLAVITELLVILLVSYESYNFRWLRTLKITKLYLRFHGSIFHRHCFGSGFSTGPIVWSTVILSGCHWVAPLQINNKHLSTTHATWSHAVILTDCKMSTYSTQQFFFRRDVTITQYLPLSCVYLSIHPSICLLQLSVLLRWLNLSSCKQCPGTVVSCRQRSQQNSDRVTPDGVTPNGGDK